MTSEKAAFDLQRILDGTVKIATKYSKEEYFKGNLDRASGLQPCLMGLPQNWFKQTRPGKPDEYALRVTAEHAMGQLDMLQDWFNEHPEYANDSGWLNCQGIYGTTPFLNAAVRYQYPLEVVAFLLSNKNVDVNLSNPPMNGYTPLESAINNRDEAMVQLLLSHPAIDVTQSSDPFMADKKIAIMRLALSDYRFSPATTNLLIDRFSERISDQL